MLLGPELDKIPCIWGLGPLGKAFFLPSANGAGQESAPICPGARLRGVPGPPKYMGALKDWCSYLGVRI